MYPLYKNNRTGETTMWRNIAWEWYDKGRGDEITVYIFDDLQKVWRFAAGWVKVA